jgi:Skp family chaperone for outer membrane proteins
VQRVLNESPTEKAGAARLQELQQQKARELSALQQALEAARAALRQAAAGAARQRLEQRVAEQQADFERATAAAQADLQNQQRQFQSELRTRLNPVLEAVAKTRNVQMILNEDSSVVWSTPGFDLTLDVIERLKAATAERPAKP